jgi:ABC-type glycerol-3-phosphate transport system permease component
VARPRLSRRAREHLTGYLYLLPVAIALGGTVLFPILKAIHMSLYNHVLIKPKEYGFVGLANYARLLHDEVFWLSLWNSFLWVFGSVSFQFLGGFAAALLLHQAFRGRALVRTLTLLPWIIPGVVVALIWEFIYQPNYGLLNDVLIRIGVMTERVAWLSSPVLAMPAVILTNVWRGVPFFAIMLLAGLQAIPTELYEAARVDGASVTQRFWSITVPMLRPIIVVATATRIVWTVQLRGPHLRHDERRARQRHPDHVDVHADAGLLEPRLRLCRHAVRRPPAHHARLHDLLPADHPRPGEHDVRRAPGRDLAERVLGGPVLWVGLAALTLFAMLPFVWVFLASFKTRAELYATPIVYLPASLSAANYVEAWTSKLTPFSRFFANSLWVSSVTMVATTLVSILAGYALARFRFAGRQTFLLIFLATQMFPAVLLIAPLLSQWYALGLIDTYQALIYSNFSFTVPFTVWMLVGYFESIPIELEESAMLDGCNRFGALCRVVLPLGRPGVAATAIFAFVASWSELLFAITFTSQTEMRTLSAGLLFMVGQYEIQWGQLSAGVIISTVPVAILFTYLQRHLIQGLSAGAVKG